MFPLRDQSELLLLIYIKRYLCVIVNTLEVRYSFFGKSISTSTGIIVGDVLKILFGTQVRFEEFKTFGKLVNF